MIDLNKWLIRGQIMCTERNVEGSLWLKGRLHPVRVQLIGPVQTGGEILQFALEPASPPQATTASPLLVPQQVGPLGNLVLTWSEKRGAGRFILEWYGRNGHIGVDLVDPRIDFPKEEEISRQLFGNSKTGEEPWFFTEAVLKRIEAHSLNLVELETIEDLEPGQEPDLIKEIVAMDRLMESGRRGIPIRKHFTPPLSPPRPDSVPDSELETEFKMLLAHLSRLGFIVDLCHHISWRDLYRILVEDLIHSEYLAEFQPFHTVEHFGMMDLCKECQKEMEAEIAAIEERELSDPP